jgi:hypothetical protein
MQACTTHLQDADIVAGQGVHGQQVHRRHLTTHTHQPRCYRTPAAGRGAQVHHAVAGADEAVALLQLLWWAAAAGATVMAHVV